MASAELHRRLTEEDFNLALALIGGWEHFLHPDVIIAPDGAPYLYRWHVVPRNKDANVYFHIQVASDPERPLHDHPWDNTSVILSGGYEEIIQNDPPWGGKLSRPRVKGQTVYRKAETAHRLILPDETPYTMTLFSTGPVRRDWGFWLVDSRGYPKWRPHTDCIITAPDGQSVFREPEFV